MSSLTSTQINNTYPGLLKLEDSTSGLTNSFQTIQDGLGNNLPLKVKDGQIQGQNLFSFGYFVPDYEGPGFLATQTTPPGTSQNVLNATPFYNAGLNSFSAITYRVIVATTTTDTAEVAFYSTQFVPGLGLQPKDLILSGISLDLTTTGVKTLALPSTMSFSGFNSGIYFAVMKISNSGVTPTFRTGAYATTATFQVISSQLGLQFSSNNDTMSLPFKQGGTQATSPGFVYSTLATFKTSFVAADFSGGILNASYIGFGFGLNVIK